LFPEARLYEKELLHGATPTADKNQSTACPVSKKP
jgi:hypothetical protein